MKKIVKEDKTLAKPGEKGILFVKGTNVMKGGDDTLFTTVSGIVKFERVGKDKKKVSCYPVAEEN